jgi:hypothetical protein
LIADHQHALRGKLLIIPHKLLRHRLQLQTAGIEAAARLRRSSIARCGPLERLALLVRDYNPRSGLAS